MKKALSFDDVLLEPQYSEIESRDDVDLSVAMGPFNFEIPIIAAPMDTVCGPEMAAAMASRGGLGILHRYCSIEEQVDMVKRFNDLTAITGEVGAAIGVTGDYYERFCSLAWKGVKIFCLDVAHGHHVNVKRALKFLRANSADNIHFIAGNIATAQAYGDLAEWGADVVRIGVGSGSLCTTRTQTGHGVPTLQSVMDCAKEKIPLLTWRNPPIISDGGHKNSGDIVKALAAGADFVMLGSMLAGTDEAPGSTTFCQSDDGKEYRFYRGMASREAQEGWRGSVRSIEGVSTKIPYKGSVKDILDIIEMRIRSGLSLAGAQNIKELQQKAKFIKQTSAGAIESSAHILRK